MRLPILQRSLLFLTATVMVAGCGPQQTPPAVPESVATDLFILGENATVTGGIRVSEIYRSFVAQLDRRIKVGEKTIAERSREILEHLGLDPDTHDISFYGSLDVDHPKAVPAMILRAPLPQDALEKWAEHSDAFSRIDDTSDPSSAIDSDVAFFFVSKDSTAFFVARSSEARLVASGSAERLTEMLARSNNTVSEAPAGVFSMVGGADVWAVASDVPSIVAQLSPDELRDEIFRIFTSIVAAGGSLELGEESALFSLYLEPKDAIEAQDISDLVRGGIALLKMESEDQSLLLDFLERIRVSEYDGFSRVQIQISESDLEDWAEIASVD
ncbi:MAG: hypothetical protein BMS9Abin05_0350 [Rhodothermia bacterium]|nr:MAG: hypothetical protein BMS9Abin05_0350 [Rhodothermia bacterium]